VCVCHDGSESDDIAYPMNDVDAVSHWRGF